MSILNNKTNMENIIYNELKEVLKEELSINNEVINISKKIFEEIKNNYLKSHKDNIDDGIYLYSSSFYESVLNKKFSVRYNIYNFLDINVFNKKNKSYNITEGVSACLEGGIFIMMRVNGYCISGNLKEELLMDTIMHEVEHIFQQIKAGKTLPTDGLYNKYAQPKYIYSENELERIVSNLIYLTDKFEIDGMVNGLYGELKNIGGEGIAIEGLKKTYTYEKYKEVFELFEKLKMFEISKINKILSDEGFNYIQFIKKIEWGKRYFINKIGKVFFKYKKDMLKENNWVFKGRGGNDLMVF